MGWPSLAAPYLAFKNTNYSDFCLAIQERYDLQRFERVADTTSQAFTDALSNGDGGWDDGGPSVDIGQIVQGSGSSDSDFIGTAMTLLRGIGPQFLDPNYYAGGGGAPYGGADVNGFTMNKPRLYTPDGQFGAYVDFTHQYGGGIAAQIRSSAGLAPFPGTDPELLVTRRKPREINALTDTADTDGNTSATGQRAYLLPFGLPVLCTGAGTWVRDVSGAVDYLSSLDNAPDNTSTGTTPGFGQTQILVGDNLQNIGIWTDLKAVCQVMEWVWMTILYIYSSPLLIESVATEVEGSGTQASAGDPADLTTAEAQADGPGKITSTGGNGDWLHNYAIVRFGADATGIPGSGGYEVEYARSSQVWTTKMWSQCNIGVELWNESKSTVFPWTNLTKTFDSLGDGVQNRSWAKLDTLSYSSGAGGTLTMQWGPTAIGSVSTPWPTGVTAGTVNQTWWRGYEQMGGDSTGTPAETSQLALVVRLRGDTAGGGAFVYQ